MPRATRNSSRAKERVVFPAPDKPVNQIVHPLNVEVSPRPSTCPLLFLVTWFFCTVTFVAFWTFHVDLLDTGVLLHSSDKLAELVPVMIMVSSGS